MLAEEGSKRLNKCHTYLWPQSNLESPKQLSKSLVDFDAPLTRY